MLEHYFDRPKTLDRIRASWLADPIERYVAWSAAQGYARETLRNRVPVLLRFGEYAARHGARRWEDLPALVVPFRKAWMRKVRPYLRSRRTGRKYFHVREIQRAVELMIQQALPDYAPYPARQAPLPFADQVPGFVPYLRSERGLREETVRHYLHYLRRFERYLAKARVGDLGRLTPKTLREFMQEGSRGLSGSSISSLCGCLRIFLRYLHREQVLDRDLSATIERPRIYRMARIPRSIPWEATQRLLAQVDRRTGSGRRDYAMLLLLITYGMRARELAALTLDDVHWRTKTLRIPERKGGGHSTQYRLTTAAGEAIVDYLEHGRPATKERRIFLCSVAPIAPLASAGVSSRVKCWLRRAGITVPKAGSHTLRHSVVQHLLDNAFSLQEIGRYVGHRSPDSTRVYTKIDLRHLREIASGYGEEAL